MRQDCVLLIISFHPIKTRCSYQNAIARNGLESSSNRLTRVSRTSLNPENARCLLFRSHQNLFSPLIDKFITNLMSAHHEKRTDESRCRSMSLLFVVVPMMHRAVCYFIPQPIANFPYHVDSVDRREGFDGFSSLRFCGLISGQNRCIFDFPPYGKKYLSIFFIAFFRSVKNAVKK